MVIREEYMHRCLELAARGSGFVAPNPLVGAVLVHDDRIIGEGWHRQYGEAHAEINCIESVRDPEKHLIRESTMYVSLEPCAHYGKTPPCTNRILAEGIKNVVIGMRDPFAKVDGKGIAILIEAGIQVITGILEAQCRWQNRRFLTFHQKQRPYLHLKWAQTVDGFMSAGRGERLKISGPLADRLVHKWRSEEASIMVGRDTAWLDNPQLNNRLWSGHQPLRIVTDRKLDLPAHLKMFTDGGVTIILNEEIEGQDGPLCWVEVERLSPEHPESILNVLFALDIQSVLIEGGQGLLQSFLQKDLWDEIHVITNAFQKIGDGLKAPEMGTGKLFEEFQLGFDKVKGWYKE